MTAPRRPRSVVKIDTTPVAQSFADEKIIEYSSPAGGGLIAFIVRGGRLRIEPYRHDDTVDVILPGTGPLAALFTAEEIEALIVTAADAVHGDPGDLSERQTELAGRARRAIHTDQEDDDGQA